MKKPCPMIGLAIIGIIFSLPVLTPHVLFVAAQQKGGVVPNPAAAPRPGSSPQHRKSSRSPDSTSRATATDTNLRASSQYDSYHTTRQGPILDCTDTSEKQLAPGELRVSVPSDGCTGWFIINRDPTKPTLTNGWRWDPDGEVLEEVSDRGGYGMFKDNPTRSPTLHLVGNRTRAIRFKGVGKPVTITFVIGEEWAVAVVRNDTKGSITYQVLQNGSWESFTLETGYQRVHSWLNSTCPCIKYDYKYEPGYQEKKYEVQFTRVVGRTPTEADKEKAKVNYFGTNADGDIILYAAPEV